jgi:hypothetical protein
MNRPLKYLWDYDPEELKNTEAGKILLLERQINYGPEKGEKIKLTDVRKYWNQLNLFPKRRKLLKLFI